MSLRVLLLAALLGTLACPTGAAVRGRPVSRERRFEVIDLVLNLDYSVEAAMERLSRPGGPPLFHRASVYRWIKQWHRYGHLDNFPRYRDFGWSKKQQARIVDWIEGTGGKDQDHRDLYLDELVEFIAEAFGRLVTERAVFYLLRRMGYTRKKLSVHASARCALERQDFVRHMLQEGYAAEQLVFADETGTNTRDWVRSVGYAKRGMRASKALPLIRGVRYNVVAAIGAEGLCAIQSYASANNTETVMHFLQEELLKDCGEGGPMNPFPGKRSVLVLDNASYHHAEDELVLQYCQLRGVRVEFLPGYSPDLNPIEELFSAVKHRIRREYRQLSASTEPLEDLLRVFSAVGTPSNAKGWMQHSGYM